MTEQNGAEVTTTATTGLDHAPTPESNGKYDRYYKMNETKVDAGTDTQTNSEKVEVEDKAEARTEPQKPKVEPKPKREWTEEDNHRVRVLTAQKKRQAEAHQRELQAVQAQLAELRAKVEGSGKVDKPVLKRENFATDEDYVAHIAEEKAQELFQKQMADYQKQQQELQQAQSNDGAFKQSWAQKVNANFPDPRERQEFIDLLDGAPDTLAPDVHEFVQHSDVGARMLKTILASAELHDALMNVPASVRGVRLGQLETAIYNQMQSKQASQVQQQAQVKPKVTQAPAPIGQIATSGTTSARELSTEEQVREYKRKNFRG